MLLGIIIKISSAAYRILISIDQRAVDTCSSIILKRDNILNLRLIYVLGIDLHIYGIGKITSLVIDLRIDLCDRNREVFSPADLLLAELILNIRFTFILSANVEHVAACSRATRSCYLVCEKHTAEQYSHDKNDAEISQQRIKQVLKT